MRIAEDTTAFLALRDRTLWLSTVFVCAAMILVAFAFNRAQTGPLVSAALFLMFALAFVHASDVTFDKQARTCAIRRLDVLRIKHAALSFDDIVDVRVEVLSSVAGSRGITCRLALVTETAVLPLTASYEPGLERYNQMRDQVVEALFEERARPAAVDPVVTLAKQGRTIEAVAVLRQRDGLDLTTAKTRVEALRKQF